MYNLTHGSLTGISALLYATESLPIKPEQWDPPGNHDQVAIRPNGIVRIPQFMQLLSENWVLKLPNIKRVQYRIEHVFKENWPPNYYAIVICSFPVHLKGKVEAIFKIQYEKITTEVSLEKSSFNQLHLSFVLYSDVNLNYSFHVSHVFCCLSLHFGKLSTILGLNSFLLLWPSPRPSKLFWKSTTFTITLAKVCLDSFQVTQKLCSMLFNALSFSHWSLLQSSNWLFWEQKRTPNAKLIWLLL